MVSLLIASTFILQPIQPTSLGAYREALSIIEAAAAKADRKAITVAHFRGTWDLATRLQGRQWRDDEPVALRQTLAVSEDGRVLFESERRINADALEHLRIRLAPGEPSLILDRVAHQAIWNSSTQTEDAWRYRHILPNQLLQHALIERDSLRHLGRENGTDKVLFAAPGMAPLTMHISDGQLVAVDYLADLPLRGDSTVSWKYGYGSASSMPAEIGVFVNDQQLLFVSLSAVSHDPEDFEELWSESLNITFPPVPEPKANSESGSLSRPSFRELSEGVYLAPNVRSGFHHLFVEFKDFVAVVDAPTGWLELQQLPAMNWAGDVSTSSAATRLIDTVADAIPDKPIRYLVLTHHHSDHAGGFSPFVEQGATVVGSQQTIDLVHKATEATFTLNGESYQPLTALKTVVVEERWTIEDETQALSIIDVGPNPHVDGMLVAWLPGTGILYQADLFEPAPDAYFPSEARLPVMRWFVQWLEESGLEPREIRAIHGTSKITEEQLETIRIAAES